MVQGSLFPLNEYFVILVKIGDYIIHPNSILMNLIVLLIRHAFSWHTTAGT